MISLQEDIAMLCKGLSVEACGGGPPVSVVDSDSAACESRSYYVSQDC